MFPFPGLVENFPAIGLFVLLLLGVIGFPFPEDAILLTCGFLIARGSAVPALTLISVYCGLLLTDFILYSVGRKYGRMVITHRKFSRILSREKLSRMERAFTGKGVLVILLGRQILGIRSQVLLSAGVMKMPSRRFLLSDAVSAMITLTLIAGAGYLGGHNLEALRRHISRISFAALIFLTVLFVIYFVFRYLRSRRSEVRPDIPNEPDN
ncbi:MAG: DedA family protein [Candidatus Sulfobium sp.]